MSSTYEIEIKSLLQTKDNAELLKEKILADGAILVGTNGQLNHYFILHSTDELVNAFSNSIPADKKEVFEKIISEMVKQSL